MNEYSYVESCKNRLRGIGDEIIEIRYKLILNKEEAEELKRQLSKYEESFYIQSKELNKYQIDKRLQ